MKKLLSLLLAFAMLFALAACGAADDDAADDAAADDAAADDAAADDAAADDAADDAAADGFDWAAYEGVEVAIHWQESDSTQIDIVENFAMPAVQAIADEYGFTVEWSGLGEASITQLAATGSLPDIWFGSVTLEMIESDVMLDLAPYLTADTYLEDNYLSPDFYYFNGNIWSLSTGVDAFYNGALYYNKGILEECGVAEADLATYEGLVAACEKIAAKGYVPLTFEGARGGVMTRFFWQNCVISVDPDAYTAIIDGAANAFSNSAIEASLAQVRDLADAGYTGVAVAARSTEDAIAAFGFGEAAMLYCDSWQNVAITDAIADEFECGVAWWPSANADYETGYMIAGWGSPLSGWCSKADEENPELIVELLKVINKAEAARHLAAGLGCNHFQEGSPEPANEIEALRLELRESVGSFVKGYNQNSMDATANTVMSDVLNGFLAEDAGPVADYAAQMEAAWADNTFFG